MQQGPGENPSRKSVRAVFVFFESCYEHRIIFHGNIDMYLSSKKDFESIEFVVAEINSFKVEKKYKNGGIRFSFRDFEIYFQL